MLDVTFVIVLTGDNGGQAMFFTDLATGAADLVIPFEFKSMAVKKMEGSIEEPLTRTDFASHETISMSL